MTNKMHNLNYVVAAVLICAMSAISALAQSSTTLEDLYSQLSEATPEEARGIERRIWREWSKSGSASIDLIFERGRDALEEGNLEAAIEHLTAVTDHAPEFAEGFGMRATAYFQAELYGPALEDLARTLALEPRHFGALFGFGIMMLELGRIESARAAFEQVASIHPHYEDLSTAWERLDVVSSEKDL